MTVLTLTLLVGMAVVAQSHDTYMRPPVSKANQKIIVDTHNELRASASNPQATDMEKMVWDDELARLAQAWAEQCVIGHDGNRYSYKYNYGPGQNGFFGSANWRGGVKAWYNEIKYFTYGSGKGKGGGVIGHFTQVMQHGSAKVGCGYAKCKARYTHYLFCNYIGPNWSLAKPWTNGTSCAACTKSCNNNLCDCDGLFCFNGGKKNIDDCTCTCRPEYYGRQCLRERCPGLRCHNAGKMDVPNCKCKCNSLYIGPTCEILNCPDTEGWACGGQWKEPYCKKFSNVPYACPYMCGICDGCGFTCKNGGTIGYKPCRCACKPGYTGDQCEKEICPGVNCLNGAKKNLTTCKCECKKLWKGDSCETKDCPTHDSWVCGGQWPEPYCKKFSNVPASCPYMCGFCKGCDFKCENGGVIKNFLTCKCHCKKGYTGDRCADEVCAGVNCQNGGKKDLNTCKCKCPKLYTGDSCETEICPGVNCQNGGKKNLKSCKCACPKRPKMYTGDSCETEVCPGLICQNRGKKDYKTCKCKCTKLYTGDSCETKNCPAHESYVCGGQWPKPYCKKFSNVPESCPYMCGLCDGCGFTCQNGGKINYHACKCACKKEYKGPQCEEEVCPGVKCINGGKADLAACKCNCPKLYIGDSCETKNCPAKDEWMCGGQWKKDPHCKKYSNVPKSCPHMCGVCP